MSQPSDAIAVVALKQLALAKSRLVELHPMLRQRWVLAMATDTVIALAHRLPVVVVSDQPSLQSHLGRTSRAAGVSHPVTVIADGQPDLNAALRLGDTWGRERGARTVLAAVADLPTLTAPDVGDLLAVGTGRDGRWFVPDAEGFGTTVLLARGLPLDPQFGVGSAGRHRQSGAAELDVPARVRSDVDTLADLEVAVGLGVGQHTERLLGIAGTPGSYAAVTATTDGRLVGDDGVARTLTRAPAGWRRLAPGQRVHAAVDGDRVLSVWY